MASRIAAVVVIVVGVAALAWVGLRGNDSSSADLASSALQSTAVPASGSQAQTPASEQSDAESETEDSAVQGSTEKQTEVQAEVAPEQEPPENMGPRMDLVEIDGWLNTSAGSIDDFDGKVLLVEMWTFGCHNCKARIPYNQSYYEEFAGENFEIIGVHAPEFSYEADVGNIEQALVDLGVTWPVALDTDKKNFRAWQPGTTSYWPRTYVIDQNGDIRYDHIGEGKYEELRETIRYLIDNPPAASATS